MATSAGARPAGNAHRRAKVICTLGPACAGLDGLRGLIAAGMDVARLNCAHGDREWQRTTIAGLRRAAAGLNREVGLLLDLAGPKIRTGALLHHQPLQLEPGGRLRLAAGTEPGHVDTSGLACCTASHDLSREVKPGEPILLDDGKIELRVEGVTPAGAVFCRVVNGGTLGEHKGINLPGTALSIPALTEKDIDDLHFGLEQGVDFVALSFVRSPDDIGLLRREMATWAAERGLGSAAETPIIAKLEKPQAIANLEAILACADGVMVARGDLGVEMPLEKVPGLQKRIIAAARRERVPVITATQMLESMTASPRPTRAEVSDVANAVLDGSDALMLSGETAAGSYPQPAAATMSRIITETEADGEPRDRRHAPAPARSIPETIAESVVYAARSLRLAAIVVYTKSGSTAHLVSAYRPPCPIYALAADPRTRRRLALGWGITPLPSPEILSVDEMLEKAERALLHAGLVRAGEIIAVVSGAPYGVPGKTNLMKIVEVSPH